MRVSAGLVVAAAAGFCASRAFTSGLTRREKLAWSLASGLVLHAVCLVFFFALGIRPRAATLTIAESFVAAVALVVARPSAGAFETRREDTGSRWLIAVLAGVAGLAWLIFLIGSLADGMWATDYLAVWGYKARVLFSTASVPQRLFADPALDFAHPEYPLLVPLSLSGLAVAAGRWDDQALALLYPACALATLLALSGFLARRVSRLSGALAAALAALCFFLYRPIHVGTAEIPFAFGAVLAASAAWDSLRSGAVGTVARLAVVAFFCAAIKQEGALFATLLAVALWLGLRRAAPRRAWIAAAALILTVAGHGLLVRLLRGSVASRDFDFSLLSPDHWSELPARFSAAAVRILENARPAAVALAAIAAFLLVTRRGAGDWLLPVFAGQLLAYATAFSLSAFGPAYAVDSAFARIASSLFPAFTLVLCARLPERTTLSPT